MSTDRDPADDTGTGTTETAAVLAELRREPVNVHLLRGYGPLVAALALLLAMMVLAPSVAPERIVERPVGGATTTELEP